MEKITEAPKQPPQKKRRLLFGRYEKIENRMPSFKAFDALDDIYVAVHLFRKDVQSFDSLRLRTQIGLMQLV